MTTGVAESETQPTEIQTTPASEPVEETTPTQPEADSTESLATDSTEANQEGTVDEASFDPEQLEEWKAVVPSGEGEPAPKSELPGESLDDLAARQELSRAANYRRIMQASDADFQTWAQRELALSPEESGSVWNKVRPYLRAIDANNASHNALAFNESVTGALPKEQADEFFSRSYNSQADALKAIAALSAQAKDKEWQARIEKGEVITKEQAKKIALAAHSKGRGEAEKEGVAGATSGSNVRGSGSSSPGQLTEEYATNAPVTELLKLRGRSA